MTGTNEFALIKGENNMWFFKRKDPPTIMPAVLPVKSQEKPKMELSANQQMLMAEIQELISVLGISEKESGDVLIAMAEDLAKPVPPPFDPQEFVVKMSLDAAKAQIKTASRKELESWFSYFFPKGTPQLLADSDLRAYLAAAINYRKKVLGNCP